MFRRSTHGPHHRSCCLLHLQEWEQKSPFLKMEEEVKNLLCWENASSSRTNDIPFCGHPFCAGSPHWNRRTSDMCCQAQSCSRVLSGGRCVRLHAILLLSFTWLAQVGSLHLGCHLMIRFTSKLPHAILRALYPLRHASGSMPPCSPIHLSTYSKDPQPEELSQCSACSLVQVRH